MRKLQKMESTFPDGLDVGVVINQLHLLAYALQETNDLLIVPKRKKRSLSPFGEPVYEPTLDYSNGDSFWNVNYKLGVMEQHSQPVSIVPMDKFAITDTLIESLDRRMKRAIVETNELTYHIELETGKKIDGREIQKSAQTFVHAALLAISSTMSLLEDIRTAAISGKGIPINQAMVDWVHLNQSLNDISEHLESGQRLPWDVKQLNRMITCYRLLTMKVYTLNNRIILEITVPIVQKEPRKLYEAATAPFMRESAMYYVQPKSKYVTID